MQNIAQTKPGEGNDGPVKQVQLLLDIDLHRQAKSAASLAGVTLRMWISQAIRERLDRQRAA